MEEISDVFPTWDSRSWGSWALERHHTLWTPEALHALKSHFGIEWHFRRGKTVFSKPVILFFPPKNSFPQCVCINWDKTQVSGVDSRIPKTHQSVELTQVIVLPLWLGVSFLRRTLQCMTGGSTACWLQYLSTQEGCCMPSTSFRESLPFTLQSSNLLLLDIDSQGK